MGSLSQFVLLLVGLNLVAGQYPMPQTPYGSAYPSSPYPGKIFLIYPSQFLYCSKVSHTFIKYFLVKLEQKSLKVPWNFGANNL